MPKAPSPSVSAPSALARLPQLVFWLGFAAFSFGMCITFSPGGQTPWFVFTGSLLLAGLFAPRWLYRLSAVVLVTVSLYAAVTGYRPGQVHHPWLEKWGLFPPPPR